MLSALQRALTQPASFFEIESRDPSLRRPAVVVGLVAVAGLVGTIPTILAVADALPAGAGIFAAISFALGSLSNLIGPFVSWLIVGTALFLGSLVVGGDGEPRDLFALVGWGFAPRVVAPIVGGIVSFVIVSGTDFSDPQQARQVAEMSTTGAVALVTYGVNTVTFLWAGWLWTHALANARRISTRHAAVIVGVVVVFELLLNVGVAVLSASLL
ncbi:MAG: YIP1 family protein [Haloarcula sp.]